MKTYDFYYSQSHDKHLNMVRCEINDDMPDVFVNGIKYTEMIDSGKEPMSKENFGHDLKKVYSGIEGKFKITYKYK